MSKFTCECGNTATEPFATFLGQPVCQECAEEILAEWDWRMICPNCGRIVDCCSINNGKCWACLIDEINGKLKTLKGENNV